jgi:hypothetical protein
MICRGSRLTIVMIEIFSRVSVRGLYSRNHYRSSNSTVFTLIVDIASVLSVRMVFFYPIHYIGLVHSKNFSHPSAADSPVVHFDCQFFGFFRILMAFAFS